MSGTVCSPGFEGRTIGRTADRAQASTKARRSPTARTLLAPLIIVAMLAACGGSGGSGTTDVSSAAPDPVQPASGNAQAPGQGVTVAPGQGASGGSGAATSQICANVSGTTAVYWDLQNGIPRGDLPNGIPLIRNPGGRFQSSVFPTLGFTYPAGYQAREVVQPGSGAGAVVTRNDGQVLWKQEFLTPTGATPRQLRQQQYASVQQFFGLQGVQTQVLCDQEGQGPLGGGFSAAASNVLLAAGPYTIFIGARVSSVNVLGSVFIQVAAAPSAEFGQLIETTFLAIDFQMLGGGGGADPDRDNDGTPDARDPAPDDPNIKGR